VTIGGAHQLALLRMKQGKLNLLYIEKKKKEKATITYLEILVAREKKRKIHF
jgi:hypothetical protein